MGVLDLFRREVRASVEDPQVPISSRAVLELFGLGGLSASGVQVTLDNALGVPAVWAAVNVIASELASLPLQLFRKTKDGREPVVGGLAKILHDAVTDDMSSFLWRKCLFEQVLTNGRSFTLIERNASGRVMNLFLLDPNSVTVRRQSGVRQYKYRESGLTNTYEASEIIDIAFSMMPDGLNHRSPITVNADTIGLAIAATQYGSRYFQNGGVPPFAITGGFQSPGAMSRAGEDMKNAVIKASKESRQALVLPNGLEIKPIGVDPEKSQLVELQRFIIEQIARIYSLPPTFLQDLTHGTFSNTEQQDLHFVKHTLKRWVDQFEQELNLKLFGRINDKQYVALNIDGLLRGDFKTRMEGYAQAIQHGILKPNEARRMENRPSDPDGDYLMIQGGTVPIKQQLSLPLEAPKESNNGA